MCICWLVGCLLWSDDLATTWFWTPQYIKLESKLEFLKDFLYPACCSALVLGLPLVFGSKVMSVLWWCFSDFEFLPVSSFSDAGLGRRADLHRLSFALMASAPMRAEKLNSAWGPPNQGKGAEIGIDQAEEVWWLETRQHTRTLRHVPSKIGDPTFSEINATAAVFCKILLLCIPPSHWGQFPSNLWLVCHLSTKYNKEEPKALE